MRRSEFESKAQQILDEQLEMYGKLSKNGLLTGDEVNSFKNILEVWLKLKDPKKNIKDGQDPNRMSRTTDNETVLKYAKGK